LATWRAYNNQYWPAEYLINQQGHIVYTHFGEGEYDVTENAIRQLLGLKTDIATDNGQDLRGVRSPEMYFGTDREEYLSINQQPLAAPYNYVLPAGLGLNQFAVEGNWQFAPDQADLVSGSGKIKLHFLAGKLFIVASSSGQPITLQIKVDGRMQPAVTIQKSQLYNLFNSTDYSEYVVEIEIP
jgi:hypothetical protein